MPYFIKKVKDGFKVCKTSDPSKCFSNEGIPHDNAVKQMKAIGISEALKGGELSESESDSNSDSSSELSSDSESDVEGSGTKSFFDQLNDLGINKEDYLKEMKKKAKNSGYKSANLSWCLDDVHKLQYLSPEGVKKFGRVGYKDFYIYQQLEKKGEVPVGYANTMKNRFRKSHGEITKKHNLNKYSPNELSINILW